MEDKLKEKTQNYEIIKDSSKIEELVKNEGWTDLFWGAPNPDCDKGIGWKLSARPPNYDGPYSDHKELVVRQKEERVDGALLVTYEVIKGKLPDHVADKIRKYMRIKYLK